MPTQSKKPRYRLGTIGSKLPPSELEKLVNLRKANQPKVKAILKTQRAMTRSWPTKRTPRVVKPREDSESTVSKFPYWDFPDGMACREPAPIFDKRLDCSHLETILEHGTDSAIESEGEELFINLGIDFGTSSTKVIARFPLEPREPTIAIPAPSPCRVVDFPHLWRTALWINSDGTASMWPVPNSTVYATLKQDLLFERPTATYMNDAHESQMNCEQVATAYLAYVIRYVRGWLELNRPQAFRQRKPVWRVNVGMPTANFVEPTLASLYRKIASAALLLADLDIQIETASTELVLEDSEILEAGQSIEKAQEIGVGVVPESAAEMTGFAKSPQVATGLYMLIDVGALTLDVSMFNLDSTSESPQIYSFLAAQVRPLGVESYFWFLNHGKIRDEFVEQCERTLLSVVYPTRRRKRPDAPNWDAGGDVPIFLVGGGSKFDLHRKVVDELDPWMQEKFRNEGTRLVPPYHFDSLDSDDLSIDQTRMGVAWGLSYDFNEIGEIHPIEDSGDIPRSGGREWRAAYIGTEQM